MLTRAVLKSYLRDMPRGHVFELTYQQFAGVFPPGDAASRDALRAFAEDCNCSLVDDGPGQRYGLTRR